MAGDWIKMRLDLQTHPKIVRILSATQADKFRVIGGLHAVWSVFDTHSADGRLDGYTASTLDHIIGWQGFAAAMISVGWLIEDGEVALLLPEYDEHNGKSGKRRAEDQKRKKEERKCPQSVRNLSAAEPDKMLTREEKRREENKEDTPPALQSAPARKSSSMTLATYLANCKKAEAKPIPDTDPVFAYADSIGLSRDFLLLNWQQFKDRYLDDTKRYTDWPKVFRTSVKQSWFKLWFMSQDGGYALTTVGQQAKRANEVHS